MRDSASLAPLIAPARTLVRESGKDGALGRSKHGSLPEPVSRYLFVDALDGVAVSVSGDEDDRCLASIVSTIVR